MAIFNDGWADQWQKKVDARLDALERGTLGKELEGIYSRLSRLETAGWAGVVPPNPNAPSPSPSAKLIIDELKEAAGSGETAVYVPVGHVGRWLAGFKATLAHSQAVEQERDSQQRQAIQMMAERDKAILERDDARKAWNNATDGYARVSQERDAVKEQANARAGRIRYLEEHLISIGAEAARIVKGEH